MENSEDIIKALSAPFPKEDLRFRPGNVAKGKGKALALVYIDSRSVQERFDNVVGMFNWQNRHICYDGKSDKVVCEISLRINGEWITKSDGAGDTAVEGEKGSFSHALKRAAVLWGVGRYLYDCKNVWVPFDEDKKKFSADPWGYFKFPAASPSTQEKSSSQKKEKGVDKKYLIDLPTLQDGGVDWMTYTSLMIKAYRMAKTLAETKAVRDANEENLNGLGIFDEKLREQVSIAGREKFASFKDTKPKPPVSEAA